MAYAFNDDKSKVQVLSADTTLNQIGIERSARVAGDSNLKAELNARINNILDNQDLDPNKDSELVDIRTDYNGTVRGSAGDAVRSTDFGFARTICDLRDNNSFTPFLADWQNGAIQWNSSSSDFGHIILANQEYRIVMTDKYYAETDLYVQVDDGFQVFMNLYSSDNDDDYLANNPYSYYELGWHTCCLIPSGTWWRLTVQRENPDTTVTENIEELSNAVKVMSLTNIAIEAAKDMIEDNNIVHRFIWKHNADNSSHLANRLYMRDIAETTVPIRIVVDDDIYFSVQFYDDNDNAILLRSKTPTIPLVNNGTKTRYRIYIGPDASGSTDIEVSYNLLDKIHMYEQQENYYVIATNANPGVNRDNHRNIMANIEKAEHSLLYYLEDYSVYGLQYYTYPSFDFANGDYHAIAAKPVYIPRGTYYRISIGPINYREWNDNAEASAAAALIKCINLDGIEVSHHSIDGIRDDVSYLKTRVAALEGAELPSYYEDSNYSISNRCNDIVNLMPACVPNKAQFIFITDMHALSGNSLKSRLLMNKVIADTNVDMVVNGGDIIDDKPYGANRPSSLEFSKMIKEYHNYAVPDGCEKFLFVAGNHDAGAGWNPTTDAEVDQETLFNLSSIRRAAGNAIFDEIGKFQYYVDDQYRKIRWIVASYGNTVNIGNWDSSASHGVTGESNQQCLQFIAGALHTVPHGWTVVVFNHILINNWPNKGAKALEDICDAYNAKTTVTTASTRFDFTHDKGEIACIIGGHSHVDWEYVTDGGIRCIMVTTDCRGQQYVDDNNGHHSDPTIRVDGTYAEQAFDVFTIDTSARTIKATRIGFGSDRNWVY
jgi:hypothetical protein